MSAYIFNPQLLPPPPPVNMGTIQYSGHTSRGSVGPVIGVLIMVFILGAASVLFGRFCSGPGRIMGPRGRREYDIENYVETKCSSCIDGGVDTPAPQPAPAPAAPAPAPAPAPARVNNNGASSSRQAQAATATPTPSPIEEKNEEGGEPQRTQCES